MLRPSTYMQKKCFVLTVAELCVVCIASQSHLAAVGTASASPPFMGNGVKIGELTSGRAILWTRLTKITDYKKDGPDFISREVIPFDESADILGPDHDYGKQVPPGTSLEEMKTAVPGMAGDVRVTYWTDGKAGERVDLGWVAVDEDKDFTKQFVLSNLAPDTRYSFRVEGRSTDGGSPTDSIEGAFTTAPVADQAARVSFTVVTGAKWITRDDRLNGQKIYPQMAAQNPSFFVHTGDIVYYDNKDPWVTHIDLARFKWNRMYALPFVRAFHQQVPTYFMKDDHDSWQNDCWPNMTNGKNVGQFTWEQGRNLFLEQVPMGDSTYRTVRWGKDLQVWLVEGRDFRSPNDAPDGPDKTIWGKKQLVWLKRTITASDATFRILISPTPIVGPDHLWKSGKVDNLVASGRAYEGNLVRDFLGQQQNLYVVCGDRHWQYVSEDPRSGVREYSCGPTTDWHAVVIQNEDRSTVKYLKSKGGFLSVTVDREDGVPTATFRHYGVDGQLFHEDVRPAS